MRSSSPACAGRSSTTRSRPAATSCGSRCADLGWGSVIGNYARPRRDLPALRPGHGGASAAWKWCSPTATCCAPAWARCPTTSRGIVYKRGLGPTPDQLFMQSNYGIVTKMGVWLMPQPQTYMPFWVRVWKEDDLGRAGRHAAQAAARSHDRGRAVALQHDLPRLRALEPLAVVRRRGADSRRRDRPHRARARDRPLDHPLARCGATTPSSSTTSRRSRRRSSRSPAPRCGGRSTTPRRPRRWSIRPT